LIYFFNFSTCVFENLAKEWNENQLETFIKTANAVLKESGDEGNAIATGIKQAKGHKENATDYPNFYYAKHMAPGLCGYENENILIDEAAIKEMIPTFLRKPVVVMHQDINLDNLESRDGTVIESFYNEPDGCLWVKMLIETGALKTARTAIMGTMNSFPQHKDIFEYAVDSITAFLQSKGWDQ